MAPGFPYLPVASGRNDAFLMPLVPLELQFKEGDLVQAHGLLDSGATVNVLPYGLGVRLGAASVNVAQPSRLRVRAASRGAEGHRARTPGELAGADACATTEEAA